MKLAGEWCKCKQVGEIGWRISGQVVGNTCKLPLDKRVDGRSDVLQFRRPKDKMSCIVLNLLTTVNQRSGWGGGGRKKKVTA